jgi:hypothetical protein
MELKVFITSKDAVCGEHLGRHAWITLVEDKGARCLSCSDLDHLAFLPLAMLPSPGGRASIPP